jgi:hypothetical protein
MSRILRVAIVALALLGLAAVALQFIRLVK